MDIALRIVGTVAGAVLGGFIGQALMARGGTCPLTCNPVGGAIVGGLLGLTIASWAMQAGVGFTPSAHVATATNAQELDEIMANDGVVVLYSYTARCPACVRLRPTIHKLADRYAGRVVVAAVDVGAARELASTLAISAVPDVRILKAGAVREHLVGVNPETTYTAIIDRLLAESATAPEPGADSNGS